MDYTKHLYEICAVCGGRRGLHNYHNQRCPVDPNASADHTEYRDTVFSLAPAQPLPSVQGLVDALEKIVPVCGEGGVSIPAMLKDFQKIRSIASEALSKFKSQEPGIDGWVKIQEGCEMPADQELVTVWDNKRKRVKEEVFNSGENWCWRTSRRDHVTHWCRPLDFINHHAPKQ